MLNTEFILHLTLIEGIGPQVIQKIIQSQRSGVQTSDLYHLSASDWMRYFGISEIAAHKLVAGLSDMTVLEKELNLIEKHKIKLLTMADASYPELLQEIHSPPAVLYYLGGDFAAKNNPSIHASGALRVGGEGDQKNILSEDFNQSCDSLPICSEASSSARPECSVGMYRRVLENNKHNKRIAVVGARKGNEYGKRIIQTIIPDLVAAGYAIVSGGALGIDAMAHEAALQCGGKTIAILGSGLLRLYPSANKPLFKRIIESGGIVASPYPLKMEGLPHNFPARNRIVTGLSQGCLVVQAAKKSGALISAHCAMEQGREVFAVPGAFDDELSAGCHEIIQQGAKLVMNSADILTEFGDRIIIPSQLILEQKMLQQSISFSRAQPDTLTGSVVNTSLGFPRAHPELVEGSERLILQQVQDERKGIIAASYSETQTKILAACKQQASIEDIVSATQLSFEQVQSELFTLQLEGVLSQDFAGLWVVDY
jgi:DNA protecting protein DprA